MPVQIVKVQKPLFSTESSPPWLISDRWGRHVTEVPAAAIPQHVKAAMSTTHRAYFNGAWSSVVGWGLSDQVEEQDW